MARPKSDIEPRILHAARDRFLAEGVDGASLRAIARDAGTSIGMIYYYFPTKDDLFLGVIEEVYAVFLDDITTALEPDVPVPDRLRRLFTRLGSASVEELTVVRLILHEALVSSDRLASVQHRFQHGHVPILLATLMEGRSDGTFDPDIPVPLLLLLSGLIGALPQVLSRAADRLPPIAGIPRGDELTDLLMTILHRALGRPPSGGQSSA